jgi:hypothetical protein
VQMCMFILSEAPASFSVADNDVNMSKPASGQQQLIHDCSKEKMKYFWFTGCLLRMESYKGLAG